MLANSLLNYNYECYFVINCKTQRFYDNKKVKIYNLEGSLNSNLLKVIKLYNFIVKKKINIIFSCSESKLTTLYSRLIKILINNVLVVSGYRNSFIENDFILVDRITNYLCDSMIANNLDICKVMKKKILMSRNKMHFIPNMVDDKIFFPFKFIDQRKKRKDCSSICR